MARLDIPLENWGENATLRVPGVAGQVAVERAASRLRVHHNSARQLLSASIRSPDCPPCCFGGGGGDVLQGARAHR